MTFGAPSVVNGVTTLTGTSVNNGTVVTLVVNPDGSYTFTQSAPLVHPTSGTTEENLDVVFGFTVTDGDTDTSTGSLTVKVNDDTPVGNTVVNTAATDDECQLEFAGNANGTGDVAEHGDCDGRSWGLCSRPVRTGSSRSASRRRRCRRFTRTPMALRRPRR